MAFRAVPLRLTCAVILLLAFSTVASAVPKTWTISGGTFSDGGTFSGSFVYDADTNTYSSITISTAGGGLAAGSYTFQSPGVATSAGYLLSVTTNVGSLAGTRYMYISFGALTNAGGTKVFTGGNEGLCAGATCTGPAPIQRTVTAGSISSPAGTVVMTGTMSAAGTFRPGSTLTYTVTLTNTGTSAQADNAGNEFSDVLPASMTLVSASATSGTAVATIGTNTVTWNGTLAAGGGACTITITATIGSGVAHLTTISNQGALSYDADVNGTNESAGVTDDPATGTAGDSTVVTVSSHTVAVTATKSMTGSHRPGGTVTYTVTLRNSGTAPQTDNAGNEFTDMLPAALTLVSAASTSGMAVATIGTNTVTWNGTLAAGGGTCTITVTARIGAAVPHMTTISSQGAVSYDADVNGTNEAAGVTDDPATATANDATRFLVRTAVFITATMT